MASKYSQADHISTSPSMFLHNHFRPKSLRAALREAGFIDIAATDGAQSVHGGLIRRGGLLAVNFHAWVVRVLSRSFQLAGNSLAATSMKR